MGRPKTETVLQQLTALSIAVEDAVNARRDAIVAIMAKPYSERGFTTYEIAEAVGLSRQQLHQIYRDATGEHADP